MTAVKDLEYVVKSLKRPDEEGVQTRSRELHLGGFGAIFPLRYDEKTQRFYEKEDPTKLKNKAISIDDIQEALKKRIKKKSSL